MLKTVKFLEKIKQIVSDMFDKKTWRPRIIRLVML